MTVKELSKLYWLNREIKQDTVRLEELYAKATYASQRITGMPHVSGVTDKVGNFAGEIADLKGILEANIQRCFYELNFLNRFICEVEDPQMRIILSLRFVNGLAWQQVAEGVGGDNTEDGVRKACSRFLKKQNLSDMSA